MRLHNNDRGFSLIEVVVALGVLGFGILAMFSMQTFAIRGNADANQITEQTTWGADGLERILTMDYDDVLDGEEPDQAAYVNDSLFTTQWNVTPDSPMDGISTIEVTITNKVDGKAVTMTYMRADPGVF